MEFCIFLEFDHNLCGRFKGGGCGVDCRLCKGVDHLIKDCPNLDESRRAGPPSRATPSSSLGELPRNEVQRGIHPGSCPYCRRCSEYLAQPCHLMLHRPQTPVPAISLMDVLRWIPMRRHMKSEQHALDDCCCKPCFTPIPRCSHITPPDKATS